MKKQKEWRPRIKEGRASVTRQGNFFVIVCRNKDEAEACEKAIIRSLAKSRNKRRG